MEGLYFFGEHVRWNLGWNNPNQAGVFIAMWIPWLWALGAWAAGGHEEGAGRSRHGLRRDVAATLVLAAELVLWFLLCKTYSRGALVAVGVAGGVFMVWESWRHRRFPGWGFPVLRWMGIGIMLWGTGFFSRVDPRFVSQDASAGNRLVLWKGGLQMIAESPWRGWGAGQSGSGFVHWFQALDATERYAGMVNSYLHVGVEYGLPVLVAVMTGAVGLCFLVWYRAGARHIGYGQQKDAAATWMIGAGCSWLVFLIANVFSTLWIFKNLWWLPAVNCLVVLGAGWVASRRLFVRAVVRSMTAAAVVSLLVGVGLYGRGTSIADGVRVVYHPGGDVAVSGGGENGGCVLFFPEPSVLGDDWGKEIRRLATTLEFRDLEIVTPSGDSADAFAVHWASPWVIVACGSRFPAGILALRRFPDAHLVLLHPLGKPAIPEGFKGRVSVILPMLDTRNSGRGWKAICKEKGWGISMSPGVGQDIRPAWPAVLAGLGIP